MFILSFFIIFKVFKYTLFGIAFELIETNIDAIRETPHTCHQGITSTGVVQCHTVFHMLLSRVMIQAYLNCSGYSVATITYVTWISLSHHSADVLV